MLTPWVELPAVAARLRWLSTVAGLDLVELGTTADADQIQDTAVTQPLLVATALAVAPELELPTSTTGVVAAGHSVGELAAARGCCCCPTRTAPRSPPATGGSAGWSASSPGRCAGTSARPRCATSG